MALASIVSNAPKQEEYIGGNWEKIVDVSVKYKGCQKTKGMLAKKKIKIFCALFLFASEFFDFLFAR